MARQPVQRAEEKLKRIIEATLFEGGIGPVTARELVEMPKAEWGILRDRITDYRQGRPAGGLPVCHVRGSSFHTSPQEKWRSLPLFRQGGGLRCPWHHGANEHPERLREEQYSGQQEDRRRIVCFVNRSTPWRSLTRVTYRVWSMHIDHRPKVNTAVPDVQVVWRDFPECVFEVQLSRTFQTGIFPRGARTTNARAWRWHGCCSDLIPSVQNSHRASLTLSAVIEATPWLSTNNPTASYAQRTIVFTCYLENADGGFDPQHASCGWMSLPFPRRVSHTSMTAYRVLLSIASTEHDAHASTICNRSRE